jgi:dihydrodipicolinate synthase/N-acetylneuraminate lyase
VTRRIEPTILATCVIPWDENYRLLELEFRRHLQLIAANITRHIYLFGTAGEGYAVTDEQFRDIAEVFADESRSLGLRPMLGVISLSLGTIISRIEFGKSLGVQEFQLSFPRWGVVTERERDVFFRETCGRFADCHFLHYNTVRGGLVLTGADYGDLAEQYPNLVAIKYSSSDREKVIELVSGAAPMQCFFTEYAYALAKEQFECGLLLSLSGVRPSLAHALVSATGARLAEVMRVITEVDDLLARCIDREQAHMDGADEKMIARAHGANLPLRFLPPYSSSDEAAFDRFNAGLAEVLSTIQL